MGRVEQDVTYDWNNAPRRVTVSSFYMDQTEVKNVDYREYLHWISRVFIDYPLVYKKALPDTLVWRRPMAYNEPYVQYYFRHPSYNDYPVVGVSWLQASDYCAWRTDRVNEGILIREGILKPDPNQLEKENFNTESYLAGQYEGLVNQNLRSIDPNQEFRRVKIEDGMLLPKYRLPTEAEWEYAALSLIGNTYEERVYERRIYPWDGHNVRNDAKANRGEMRANFIRGRGDMMGTAGNLNDNASIPGPVESFWPNDYGLYCMAGNVSEWTSNAYDESAYNFQHDLNPDYTYEAKEADPPSLKRKVIRGGSWKDVGYFLQTGTRSYEYQDTSKCYVGFRCVMDFMGRDKADF
jgi:gliding motility-associated lipoprotein GldJ